MKYIIFICLLLPIQAFAALPDYYPKVLQNTGVVEQVDHSKRTITIDGRVYNYSKNVLVYSLYSKNSYMANVRKGNKIAFTWVWGENKKDRVIVKIWILPNNYIFESAMQKARFSTFARV